VHAGARGYILKGAAPERIVRAIRSVASSEAVFGPGIAAQVLASLTDQSARTPDAITTLTPREHQVLTLTARGLRNHAIADRMRLTPKTVSNHLSAIYAKLGVADRAEAADRARKVELGQPPTPNSTRSQR
jgi:DNA-binding NarL/FixJ family response regulator